MIFGFMEKRQNNCSRKKISNLDKNTISEESVSLTEKPTSMFLDHITSKSGTSKGTTDSILEFL